MGGKRRDKESPKFPLRAGSICSWEVGQEREAVAGSGPIGFGVTMSHPERAGGAIQYQTKSGLSVSMGHAGVGGEMLEGAAVLRGGGARSARA